MTWMLCCTGFAGAMLFRLSGCLAAGTLVCLLVLTVSACGSFVKKVWEEIGRGLGESCLEREGACGKQRGRRCCHGDAELKIGGYEGWHDNAWFWGNEGKRRLRMHKHKASTKHGRRVHHIICCRRGQKGTQKHKVAHQSWAGPKVRGPKQRWQACEHVRQREGREEAAPTCTECLQFPAMFKW